ncbi:MAG: cadmium-translocating P-type ATPase [Clostridiales bacterium]|nr:cadmium-translocating P-type ATPase [Clostridiales bacterium]
MTKKQKKILIRIIIAAVLLVVLHFVKISEEWYINLPLYLVPYLVIGYDILINAVKKIFKGRFFDEEFLMIVATVGAFIIGDYPEATAVMLFYQVGELFQSIAVGKSRKSISDLMDICPNEACVIRDGKEEVVDPYEISVGEIVLVRPGEKVPIDGVIVEGKTSLNTSALTGESLPVDKEVGSNVYSGSINISNVIKIRTTSAYEDSTVSKILELVENSTDKKAVSEKFITKFSRVYTPAVVVLAVVIVAICLIFTDNTVSESVYRGLIFLVVSCPCALVVSVPLSFFGGIGAASRKGILIKGSNFMETLSKVDTIVFDKTGTITKGTFAVDAIHPSEIDADELIDIAAVAESRSNHPVAESIVRAHGKHIDPSRLGDVEEIAGKGLKAVIDDEVYYVGNGKLMEDVSAEYHECHLPGTVVHVAREGQYLGHIVINDTLKNDSVDAIRDIRKAGVSETVILTGDNDKVASKVAAEVGVDKYYAGLLPGDKVDKLVEILNSGKKVAFVGDGINDAPVLTRADIGIAMGALGSDAAIEAADIVLMDDSLSKIPLAISISRKTLRIVKENIIFSLAVKIGIMILGALGLVGMRIAVFGDVGVLIIAILNAVRTMNTPRPK